MHVQHLRMAVEQVGRRCFTEQALKAESKARSKLWAANMGQGSKPDQSVNVAWEKSTQTGTPPLTCCSTQTEATVKQGSHRQLWLSCQLAWTP